MADPDTNLEMIAQCIQRFTTLQLTLRSIINNTDFTNNEVKMLANDRLRDCSDHTIGLLKMLNKINTMA